MIDLKMGLSNRVDGRLKVTGQAKYAAEFDPMNGETLHAVLVQSTIAAGRLTHLETTQARQAPGVIMVMTRENAPKIDISKASAMAPAFPLLQDDTVLFNGQHLAVVIAERLEQAQYAATLVKAEYEKTAAVTVMDDMPNQTMKPENFFMGRRPPDSRRGTPEDAFAAAPVKIDRIYRTPVEHHNPMEPHATMAVWQGDQLTVYNATQSIAGNKKALADFLGLKPDQVRVIGPFVGGGFGTKGSTWPYVILCAMAAKLVGTPVRLVLSRRQMFTSNGFRPKTVQRLRIAARHDGTLTAMMHDGISQNSFYDEFSEPVGLASEFLYACPNAAITHRLVKVNQHLPTFMRAPGEASGVFALESAMDELAWELGMDPLDLRLKNYSHHDEGQNLPYSSKSLKECYQRGAAAFDWHKRVPKVRSMKDGRLLIGYGMATATYPVNRQEASAKVTLFADGRALVACGSQDIGTGTYTIMAEMTADLLGLPLEKVEAALGDSALPPAPVSGGSQTSASIMPAVREACLSLRRQLGQEGEGMPAEPLADVLKRQGKEKLEVEGKAAPGEEKKKFSMHSFGAHFTEVSVDPDLGEVRVRRHVGAFSAGRILNANTARSQFIGGIVYGMGMALSEATEIDANTGRVVNASILDYLVPVNLDVPEIEVIMVPESDEHINPVGVKGIGELPMVGVAGAIANAVYHATGKRIRDLPIRPDKLIHGANA